MAGIFYVYLLHSVADDGFYIGHTTDLRRRLIERKDGRGVDLISDALPFGRLWYVQPNAIGNAVD
jgi:predicted GIY-YIG superfamily endonuclease